MASLSTFACDAGYALDTSVTFVCGSTNGVATLSGQPCQLACDTVADLDGATTVAGTSAVTNANDAEREPAL